MKSETILNNNLRGKEKELNNYLNKIYINYKIRFKDIETTSRICKN